MQIPRGTFRALKRRCLLGPLIQELKDSAYDGYCRIAIGSDSMILVFKGGRIQLAEYDTLQGDPALERICRSDNAVVDAVLHDLSPVQLTMAVEFNPLALVDGERQRVSDGRSGRPDTPGAGSPRETGLRNPGPSDASPGHRTNPDHAASPVHPESPTAKSERKILAATDDETSLLSRELDAIDAMDLESMAAKFRANYRLMMERLELDHLLDKNNGKDAR